jgi:hypothetical protein
MTSPVRAVVSSTATRFGSSAHNPSGEIGNAEKGRTSIQASSFNNGATCLFNGLHMSKQKINCLAKRIIVAAVDCGIHDHDQ